LPAPAHGKHGGTYVSAPSLTKAQKDDLNRLIRELRQHHVTAGPVLAEAIPGSPEKINLLRQRYEQVEKTGKPVPICQAHDPKMPAGQGWRIVVEPNGRVVHKTLVWLASGEPIRTISYNLETGEILEGVMA
jgi:hypothetical protein